MTTRQGNEWIARVLGIDVATARLQEPSGGGHGVATALASWQSSRSDVLATLTALEKAVRASAHPERDTAVMILRSIRANLPNVIVLQRLGEVERYLQTDEIIDAAEAPNVFGIPVSIKAPLLKALAAFREHSADNGAG